MHVNESGANHETSGVEGPFRPCSTQSAYLPDEWAFNQNIRLERGIPRAVNHPSVFEENVAQPLFLLSDRGYRLTVNWNPT